MSKVHAAAAFIDALIMINTDMYDASRAVYATYVAIFTNVTSVTAARATQYYLDTTDVFLSNLQSVR